VIVNALGRRIPEKIKGYKDIVPYESPHGVEPPEKKAPGYTGKMMPGVNKLLPDITTAIRECGLTDGMTVSFHHHFRNGDRVVNLVLEAAAKLGIRHLNVALTSIFPVHAPLVEHIRQGTVARLSCNYMNGPVAEAMCRGEFEYPVIFRTHGGRDRAIEGGEEKIDVAFIGASAADSAGNFNGVDGPSACGSLGYCISDCHYARKVVVLTDNMVPYPLVRTSADETLVDYVVKVEQVGDPTGITTGAVKIISDPVGLNMAQMAAGVIEASGLLKDGISFQTGTGGVSMAVARYIKEKMEKLRVKGSFGMGGITGYMVNLLNEGFLDCLLDTQSFDFTSIESLGKNPHHVEISSSRYANPHNKGCAVNNLDVMILSATEVDVDFNVNVHTTSDGRVIGGSGGHSDTAAGSKLAIVVAPSMRTRTPIIINRVLTATTPGETIDCIVTDIGIAVNPRRPELRKNLLDAGLPVKDIYDIKSEIEKKTGVIATPQLSEDVVGVVEYRNGTVIDVIRRLA
jgi:citrate lyase subunit alpha / citrate CoA-transferase